MNDILAHDTGLVEADYYLQTHTTNPLLRAETIVASHPRIPGRALRTMIRSSL